MGSPPGKGHEAPSPPSQREPLPAAAAAIAFLVGRRNAAVFAREETMHIDNTEFGSITIDGKTYDHDVIIRLSGKVEKRKKKLSKALYGTSHVVSKDEAKFVFEDGCETLIIGAGQQGNVRLSPEASAYLDKKGCKVLAQPTPEAARSFNDTQEKKIALIHVTC
jgi:hypothetical protein